MAFFIGVDAKLRIGYWAIRIIWLDGDSMTRGIETRAFRPRETLTKRGCLDIFFPRKGIEEMGEKNSE